MKNRRIQSKKRASRSFSTKKSQHLSPSEGLLLYTLYSAKSPLSIKEIAARQAKISKKQLNNGLLNLTNKKIIHEVAGKRIMITNRGMLCHATLDCNPKGFGFLHDLQKNSKGELPSQDPYVAPHNMGEAQHGDQVFAAIFRTSDSGRSEAEIYHVIKQGSNRIAGVLAIDGEKGIVVPENSRFPFVVSVDLPKKLALKHGDAVVVELKTSKSPDSVRQGRIVENLGDPDSVASQIRFVIESKNLPRKFSNETIQELEYIEKSDSDPMRRDLTAINHVTIDGATAKDFDDAICVEKHGKNFRLYVSIADVSYYVQTGSALDRDAYERGTSVYFPGKVLPMLPEKLSNDLCSLVPLQKRLALTAILDIDAQGFLQKKSFCRSTIISKNRFTYSRVQDLLDEKQQATSAEQSYMPMLRHAEKLAQQLKKRRAERGALGFTMPEALIDLDQDGEVENIRRSNALFSQKIIEEFMLEANEAVAQFFTESKSSAIYRVHERPDPERVKEFATYAHNLGLKLGEADTSPAWFARVINESKGSEREYVINNLLLRSMKQAKYSHENVGHFGLAAIDYTHFTSPIRRYPDLMVHRELCRLIGYPPHSCKNRAATKVGDFLSGRERIATKSEREVTSRLQCIFMEKHIGEQFTATISGVRDIGFYIEFKDFPISASAPIEELRDDIYLFDHRGHNLIGQNHGGFFSLGSKITVEIRRIDRARNQIIVAPIASSYEKKSA